jgi:hypothetical protein
VPRPVAIVLILCAAAAASLTLGSALASGPSGPAAEPRQPARLTATSPLAGLNATFRKLAPEARCDAADAKSARARRLRAAANKNAAKAPPKVLRRKKASMRRAIRLLRQGGALCDVAVAPGGAPAAPGAPAPGPAPPTPPPPTPAPPGTTTISLSAAAIAPFSPSPATARAGPIRIELSNLSTSLPHSVGVRTPPPPPQTVLGGPSANAAPGGSTSLDVTLAAGTYQIYCGVGTHAASGMVIPLTVTP